MYSLSRVSGPDYLYETLLPHLNRKPLRSNVEPGMLEWRETARGGDPSHAQCVMEAVRFCLRAQGLRAVEADHCEAAPSISRNRLLFTQSTGGVEWLSPFGVHATGPASLDRVPADSERPAQQAVHGAAR